MRRHGRVLYCDKCDFIKFEYWGEHSGTWCRKQGETKELKVNDNIIIGDKVLTPNWCPLALSKEGDDERNNTR